MLTAAIYTTHLMLLIAGFWRVGPRPVMFILASGMALSWVAGAYLGGPARIVGFIILDLATIFAVKVWHDRAHDRLVALIALIGIGWAVAYTVASYMDYWTYAAGVNCAAAMQLFIGGGMADDLGRRIDHWLDSVWPWGAHALRSVAVF